MADAGLQNSPDSQVNRNTTLGVTTTLLSLCYISYALRIASRKVLKTGMWWDDWWMLGVLVWCTEMSTLDFLGVGFGSGLHQSDVPPAQLHNFLVNLYVFMFSWAIGTGVVKIGILLLYWRIFGNDQTVRLWIKIVGAIVTATHVSLFWAFIFQCTPVSFFWNHDQPGTCFNQDDFYMSGGSLNILGDVMVLALPMRSIWRLKTSQTQKLAVTFLFLLGSFVCVTSIFRLFTIKLIVPTDFTFTNVQAGIWSTVEVEVGFICANLPQCRPLFLRVFFPSRAQSQNNQSSGGQASSSNYRSRRSHLVQMDKDGFERILENNGSPTTITGGKFDSTERLSNDIPLRSIVVETQFEQTESRAAKGVDSEKDRPGKSMALTANVEGATK